MKTTSSSHKKVVHTQNLLLTIIFATGLILSCGTPASLAERDARTNDNVDIQIEGSAEDRLADRLRRQAGVTVSGNAPLYNVTIRSGVNSFGANATPLFVVNGNQVSDFSAAAQVVGTNQIKSIKVLKDSETTAYGIRGSGGVIEIKTNSTLTK